MFIKALILIILILQFNLEWWVWIIGAIAIGLDINALFDFDKVSKNNANVFNDAIDTILTNQGKIGEHLMEIKEEINEIKNGN